MVVLTPILGGCGSSEAEGPDRFDSKAAFELIEDQVAVGQRPAGSQQLRMLARRLAGELGGATLEAVPGGLQNITKTLPGPGPAIVVGAHYDTEAHPPGFVGANDGAAGTAAVVELARALAASLPEGHREIRFVLFDGEEEAPGCRGAFERCALRGSRAYVTAHGAEVGETIVLDYIANEGLRIPRELNSSKALWTELRDAAEEVGAEESFPAGEQTPILDDHVPFLQAGVPAIDLIDFSYRYADTVEDTTDKLDASALDAVGETVAELVIRLSSPP